MEAMDLPLLRLALNILHFYKRFWPYLLDFTILSFLKQNHDLAQNFMILTK